MNPFINFITQLLPLTEEEQEAAELFLTEKTFKKGQIIYTQGEVCNYIYYVENGYARSYASDANDREFTWNFYFNDEHSQFKNKFIFDYNSFVFREPTQLYFEALTDISAIRLENTALQKFYTLNPKHEKIGRLMAENAYRGMHKRAFTLLTMPAQARYEQLLNDEPALLQKFKLYYIASYLGITSESFSRLRAGFYKS